MRLAAVVALCLATLAPAAPVAVPLHEPGQAVVRVAADASRLHVVRASGSASVARNAAIPEPSGGAALLCGLLAVAFIARRKASWPEG